MLQVALSLCLSFLLTLFTRIALGAPTNYVVINHYEELKHNPIFRTSRFLNISEWFHAHGRLLEIANNGTQECISHFTI